MYRSSTRFSTKVFVATFILQCTLFLSAQRDWFWITERKGYAVLIAVAGTSLLLLLVVGYVLRSWFAKARPQFSLMTLFVMIPVMGIPCAWLFQELDAARNQRIVMGKMNVSDGIQDSYCLSSELFDADLVNPSISRGLIATFGVDFFADVVYVKIPPFNPVNVPLLEKLTRLQHLDLSGASICDRDMVGLVKLRRLKTLHLESTQVSDSGLEHLKGLSQLEVLSLGRTSISDSGLKHIEGLTRLSILRLDGTAVSEAGLESLRKSLPKCQIER